MVPALYRTLRLFWPGGLETRRNLNQLRRTQWLSRHELEALQLRRVQALVRHAYQNVPFYRQLYREAGIHPDDIQTLDDFTRLPVITRDDIDTHLDQFVDQTFPRDRLVPVETGGSTGRPLRFYVTPSFWWQNAANWFRVREWHGVREGEKIAWFWGAAQDMPAWSWRRRLRSALMQERYLSAFDVSEETMHRFARLLTRWKPAMLKGYPSVVELFARFVIRHGYNQIRPRLIETTSEKLTQPQRDLLAEAFPGAVVADHYSSRELGTIAYQCETGEMLVCADVRLLEIIANGQPAPP
ncbi:MAG: phenylacetate--CoA ligase family protein, partial [Chloroflexi bacterium]